MIRLNMAKKDGTFVAYFLVCSCSDLFVCLLCHSKITTYVDDDKLIVILLSHCILSAVVMLQYIVNIDMSKRYH